MFRSLVVDFHMLTEGEEFARVARRQCSEKCKLLGYEDFAGFKSQVLCLPLLCPWLIPSSTTATETLDQSIDMRTQKQFLEMLAKAGIL